MIGDDACSTFVELLKRILDIVSDIEKENAGERAIRRRQPPR